METMTEDNEMTDETEYIQGQPIDKYEVERELGRGGMGAVLLARDTVLGRRVALKVIKRNLLIGDATTSQKGKVEARFIREAKVSAMINHTNVATVYDATLEGDVWFIAMEYIDGDSLADMLKKGKTFTPIKAARMLHWIADGLRHAWVKHSIIHRDVKPANVMITHDGVVKLIDLGIAKPMIENEDTHTVTLENEMVATPRYSAPEQMLGRELTEKADIFALGVLAYETLAKRPAFQGVSIADIYAKKSIRDYVPLSELRDDVPGVLDDLIERMLSPEAEDRPGYDAILSVLGDFCNTGTGTRVLQMPSGPPRKKSRNLLWAGLVACLAVAVAISAMIMRPKSLPVPRVDDKRGIPTTPTFSGPKDKRVGSDFVYGSKLRMDMVWVPELKGWASRHETTVNQLCKCPSFRSKTIDTVEGIDFSSPSMPAVMVTRNHAKTYCGWLNQLMGLPNGYEFRLPSLKEWRSFRSEGSAKIPSRPVPACKAVGDSRGFTGMTGNVWEITSDGCACGGSWLSEPWEYAPERPAEKMAYADGQSDHNVGFRLLLMPATR